MCHSKELFGSQTTSATESVPPSLFLYCFIWGSLLILNFEILPIWTRKAAFVIVAHFNYTLENERNLNSSKYVCHHR